MAIYTFDYQITLGVDRKRIIPAQIAIYDNDVLPTGTLKIGFFGGAGEPDLNNNPGSGVNERSLRVAAAIAKTAASYGAGGKRVIQEVTGAPPGNIGAFAKAAYHAGSRLIGISPFYDEEHHRRCGSPTQGYSVIVYIGTDRHAGFDSPEAKMRLNREFSERDGFNVLATHAGIFIGGNDGTDEERSTAKMRGLDIGFITGTGGVADAGPEYMAKVGKETGSRIVTDIDPAKVFEAIFGMQLEKLTGKKPERLFLDDIIDITNDIKKTIK